jgi:hypothetical protein
MKAAREWLQNHQLVGRRADTQNLSVSNPGVQPVFGIAGVGKSYIVPHVYTKETFPKVWVGRCIPSIQYKGLLMEITLGFALGISPAW